MESGIAPAPPGIAPAFHALSSPAMSTCIPPGGRPRSRVTPAVVVLVASLASAAAAVLAQTTDPSPLPLDPRIDRTLRLESIAVVPDDPAVAALVRQHLRLVPGEPGDVAVLTLARETLEQCGYFREVMLYTSRGSRTGLVVLHVEVALDCKVRFLTGFGYEPLDGWYLNLLGARLLNRPRPGSELRLAWRDGYFTDGIYIEGRMPSGRRPGEAWLVDVDLEDKTWFVYDQREGWEQDIHTQSLRLGRLAPIAAGVTASTWLGVSHTHPDDELTSYLDDDEQTRPASDLIADPLDDSGFLDIWLEGAWDARDPVRPWWRGSWVGMRLRASHETGESGFLTFELDGRHTRPVADHAALAARVRAAHADPETPYHQRFRFGGVYSVRGYDFAYLSGASGACNLVQANLELRAGLLDRAAALPRVTGVLFLDTGQAWDPDGRWLGWVVGAGYGIRVRLPWVQLLGMEVGYPLVNLGDIPPLVVNVALGWSY